jgi:hypothetical protein
MPPKKAKNKEDAPEDTGEQSEMKIFQREAERLHDATKMEDKYFNEFQQQREKLNYFWIVEKKKLEDKRAELRNKERELQDLEEKHQVEIKIYKQRLKHLLNEHQNEISLRKTEAEMAVKMSQDDNRETELDMRGDKRSMNLSIKDMELSHEEFIRSLKREQDQKITSLRHEFERKANEVQKTFDTGIRKMREDLDKARREEIKAIEDRKAVMIEKLMAEHSKAFTDIKNYYNDITHNNLDYIKSLKEEVKELEVEERKDKQRLLEKQQDIKKLTAPLKRKQEELKQLEVEYQHYDKEKDEMRRVKSSLGTVEGGQTGNVWEYETLFQRFQDLKKERDELKEQLFASMFDVKQKSAFRGLLLEKKLAAMYKVQEEREAQLNEVLARANLDPSVLGQVKGHVDNVLHRKNAESRNLQGELSRLKALHEQLQACIESKLREYGLTVVELGYDPSAVQTDLDASTRMTRTGPAAASETV